MQLTMEILVSIFSHDRHFLHAGRRDWNGAPARFIHAPACPNQVQYLRLRSFLIAAMIYSAFQGRFGFAELLLTLFAFLTAPVSANLMAQAALHLRLRSLSGDVPEALNRPLPWQRTRRRAFSNKHEDTEHRL